MILRNIKLHASNQAGSDIKDTVLAVPANWGWKSRMTLINAANIAELSVLGLINENSAAAINFAISRNDSDPINIGFFNLGSHNLQFSIVNRNHNLDTIFWFLRLDKRKKYWVTQSFVSCCCRRCGRITCWSSNSWSFIKIVLQAP